MKQPKILFFDIETKPVKAWIWRTGEQRILHERIVRGEKFDIICICWKWAHSKKIYALDWGLQKQDSASMINKFAKVIESADVVIGQNSDSFDVKQINTQRLLHGQPPIAWPTTEDTRKQIKQKFYVTSSSLEYMSQLLTGAGKSRMEFRDWIDIIEDKKASALKKMVSYCKRDVQILYNMWRKIRPHIQPKAHIGVLKHGKKQSCPSCGSFYIHRRGYRIINSNLYPRLTCNDCRHVWRSQSPHRP